MKKENYILSNGISLPAIAYGTYLLNKKEEAYQAVKDAIEVGYRHIDCAYNYYNEDDIGQAIKDSKIKRSELFLTSKIWNNCESYEDTMDQFKTITQDLKTDYLDLLLIHFPNPLPFRDHYIERNLNVYKAMEDLYKKGKVKAIGVSNFEVHHLEELRSHIEIPVMVDQIEFHPYYFNKEVYEYCKKEGICLEAHSTLGRGRILLDAYLNSLAVKYNRTVAQICGRYALDHDAVAIMKSKDRQRMASNLNILDFEIAKEDLEELDRLVQRENKIGSWPDQTKY